MKQDTNWKPPYLLGLLGLIPLVGFFVGISLILYSIFRYKDRKLTWIGIFCILFTVLVYSVVYAINTNVENGFETLSQRNMTVLVKEIEIFRNENNRYPNNLKELKVQDSLLLLEDPIQAIENKKDLNYVYKNLVNHYFLFSKGKDGKSDTNDDISPSVEKLKSIGWRKSE